MYDQYAFPPKGPWWLVAVTAAIVLIPTVVLCGIWHAMMQ